MTLEEIIINLTKLQVAQTLFLPIEQVFSNLGAIGAGFKLWTYETGTTTPLTTYSDTALTVANTNPIIADSAGRFIQTFIDDAKLYKLVLLDADDNTIWTADPVDPKTFSLNDFDPRPTSFWGTTSGTSTVYTLAADPAISEYSNKHTFFLDFHIACGASPTIAINGLTALTIKKSNGSGGKLNLEVDDVLTGTYEARNDGTDIVILNPEKPARLNFSTGDELTIATGAVTIVQSQHTIDTEDDAATDDLDTINGGTKGQVLIISTADSARDVVLKHGTGNIITPNGADITLYTTNDRATLQYDGTNWLFLHTKRPGEIVQIVNFQTGALATSTTEIPSDDTIPQITEGSERMTLAITPVNAANKLKIDVIFCAKSDIAEFCTVALFQDSTVNALAAAQISLSDAGAGIPATPFTHYMTAGTASTTTFRVRAGGSVGGGGTITFNGNAAVRRLGGVMASSITITEIQA